jgi:hypothetical protein
VTGAPAVVLAFLTVACARPGPVPTSSAAPDPTPPDAATAPVEASGPADMYARLVPDAKSWLDEHHVQGALIGEECFAVTSGVPPAPGLLCRESPHGTNARPTVERVYRVDGERIVQVWRGTVVDPWHWAHLVVDIDANGSRLVLRDDVPCHCERAAREDMEKAASNVQPASLSEGLRAACVGRGVYLWSGRRYVRDLDAGEGPWSPPACPGAP